MPQRPVPLLLAAPTPFPRSIPVSTFARGLRLALVLAGIWAVLQGPAWAQQPPSPPAENTDAWRTVQLPLRQLKGSYNAIRTYLWSGLSRNDPAFERLALAFLPWLHWVGQNGHAPEALNATTGFSTEQTPREGPAGFDVAALVLADSLGFTTLKRHLQTRIDASLSRQSPGYYSHALALFGLGWMEGRYRFTPQGALLLPDSACEPRGR